VVLRDGARLAIARGLRRERPLVKTTDFVIARRSHRSNAYEELMLDDEDRLLEGVSSNVYGVRRGTIVTAGSRVLEGITRRIVFELAAELGVPVALEPVRLADVGELDEAFLTSSTREVVPVSRIGEVPVALGPVAEKLRRAYQAYAARHAAPAWPLDGRR
jgi:branched-chain amino acid aminotransferase